MKTLVSVATIKTVVISLLQRLLFVVVVAIAMPAVFAIQEAKAEALKPVTLQLKWLHQFQFAGYYAAKAQGYYQAAGLDVTIVEAEPGVDTVNQVLEGKADFGIGNSELVLRRAQGDPVLVLGVIYQHSPQSIVALKSSNIETVHDLAGKRIMIEPNSAELIAYLRCEGLTERAFDIRSHGFDTKGLVNGDVDAMSVYVTDEPFELLQAGHDYQLFTPRMCAIDFYGDNLFTLSTTMLRSPAMVKAFREASIKGWQYAIDHSEEIVQLIHKQYPGRHSLEHLRYEARKTKELMRPDLIEPGYMNLGRWQHIANTYQELGLIPQDFDVTGMLYQDPLNGSGNKMRYVVIVSGIALLVSLLILATVFYFYRQARSLSNRLRLMFEYAPLSIIVLNDRCEIQSWNRQAGTTFQWQSDEVFGRNLVDLTVPSHYRREVTERLEKVLRDNVPVHAENPNLRKDGEEIHCEWMNAPFYEKQQDKSRFILCMARDVTQRRRLEVELESAAHYDNLTGLANRRLILDRLKNAIATANRIQKKVAVLFLDLDAFKKINDTYGHKIGDSVLQLVSQRLAASVRESDYVGRLAGDEFLIVLQDVEDRNDAILVADKVNMIVAEPFNIDNLLIHLTASVGISLYPDDAEDVDHLITFSDQIMYQQKEAQKP